MANEIDKESAIKQWNTRKPMERIVERLEELERSEHGAIKYGVTKSIALVKEEGGIE